MVTFSKKIMCCSLSVSCMTLREKKNILGDVLTRSHKVLICLYSHYFNLHLFLNIRIVLAINYKFFSSSLYPRMVDSPSFKVITKQDLFYVHFFKV
jgi:hypothetical protein